MAGNQASVMQVNSYCGRKQVSVEGYTRYPVPNMNKPPSSVFFNQTKAYFREQWGPTLKLFVSWLGSEEKVFELLKKEMTDYCFGTEANNLTHLYYKYKKEIDEQKAKLGSQVCAEVQPQQTVSNQSAEDAPQTSEAQEQGE